jgi:signal transduction histidine kinase
VHVTRRYWPIILALLSVLVFGSYLAYTNYLVEQIRAESRIHSEMYATVQRGLISLEEDGALTALVDLQKSLARLGVPIVVFDGAGRPTAVENLPFAADLNTVDGRSRVQAYAARLSKEHQPISVSGIGTIFFGSPPLVRWLVWVPWLQAAGALFLVLVALAIIRSNVRETRERLWASMARELAHQMGTPLSSLSGWIEVLRLPDAEREAMASTDRIADVVSADVDRLERVSRRFELIGKPPRLERISVDVIIDELASYFAPRLPRLARGIELKVRVAEDLPQIEANRVLLVWALENIVKNAIDALAGKGGRITILARKGNHSVDIDIADDGPGIDASVRDRIFEAGVSTKTSGWGVGLSLTQRIVENLHGGRIAVRNRSAGGAVFEIELPEAGKRKKRRVRFFGA